ncbi:hypothetical protein FOZ63_019632, partial [Perkinsus olseni]
GSTNATSGIGANVALTSNVALNSTDFCQSLCGPPQRSICGNKGSYCKPYGPPADGVGVCQGLYHLPNQSLCYFGPMTNSSECPEDHPVFCKRAAPTTPQPTTTPFPTP